MELKGPVLAEYLCVWNVLDVHYNLEHISKEELRAAIKKSPRAIIQQYFDNVEDAMSKRKRDEKFFESRRKLYGRQPLS